jgi:hypothetical protein
MVVFLVGGAGPASANPIVVGTDAYKWYYWIGPLLVASFLLLVLALTFGYTRKVLMPKYRGRRIEE